MELYCDLAVMIQDKETYIKMKRRQYLTGGIRLLFARHQFSQGVWSVENQSTCSFPEPNLVRPQQLTIRITMAVQSITQA